MSSLSVRVNLGVGGPLEVLEGLLGPNLPELINDFYKLILVKYGYKRRQKT
jgi:hypothetical protein